MLLLLLLLLYSPLFMLLISRESSLRYFRTIWSCTLKTYS